MRLATEINHKILHAAELIVCSQNLHTIRVHNCFCNARYSIIYDGHFPCNIGSTGALTFLDQDMFFSLFKTPCGLSCPRSLYAGFALKVSCFLTFFRIAIRIPLISYLLILDYIRHLK